MAIDQPTSPQSLQTPVQFLKGVGPRRAALLVRLGLRTARDVLFYFPRGYQDLTDLRPIGEIDEGLLVSVCGRVVEIDQHQGRRRHVLGVLLHDETGYLRATWFNQPWLREKFRAGQRVLFSGKASRKGIAWEMVHPRVEWLEDDEEVAGRLLPLYSLTEGLTHGQVRRVVAGVLAGCGELLDEAFPPEYLAEHNLWPLRRALPQIHFPDDSECLAAARRRFVYQELFVLQLALAVRRRQQHDRQRAPALPPTAKVDARIRRLFPFELTDDQRRAISQIGDDMARTLPMNRLLQGDVGSGKTVVAVYAMLLAVAHGYQAALMAPTEVLARQHATTLGRLLAASQVRIRQLTGSLKPAERQQVLAELARGEVDLVVGTHAIVQDEVRFARLGLVVIDEQHKFGVRQRATLRAAGVDPHYLVMTATPIPRTLTMTIFGDLDVSTLRELPPGRQQVHTYVSGADARPKWWDFFRRKLREGRQGYVITPLVETSEEIAAASLEQTYETLANGELEAFRLGLLHGRMNAAEKERVMLDFRSGEIQVLVATTVVEVGIDVPNATLMTIEAGERFGLSQLHQLRGRVSRGQHPGYCCVFADPQTDDARQRLEALAATTDGFQLAEVDFALRGPGDLFGTEQHGLPPFWMADLVADADVLVEARADAQRFVDLDPGLAHSEHARLRRQVLSRYGQVLDLGGVG